MHGKLKRKQEDGWRFENILFPEIVNVFYENVGNDLINQMFWNQKLKDFRQQCSDLIRISEENNRVGIRYKNGNCNGR